MDKFRRFSTDHYLDYNLIYPTTHDAINFALRSTLTDLSHTTTNTKSNIAHYKNECVSIPISITVPVESSVKLRETKCQHELPVLDITANNKSLEQVHLGNLTQQRNPVVTDV